jgi:hypothetical protein
MGAELLPRRRHDFQIDDLPGRVFGLLDVLRMLGELTIRPVELRATARYSAVPLQTGEQRLR